MRKTAALIVIAFALAGVDPTGISAQDEVPTVSAICGFEFGAVATSVAANDLLDGVSDGPSDAVSEPDISPDPAPDLTTPVADGPDPAVFGDALDAAIRSCASHDEWVVAAQLYPAAMRGHDPQDVLTARCADPTAGLDAYAPCSSLAIAMATPAPTPTPTPAPTPAPTAAPPGSDDKTGSGPRSGSDPKSTTNTRERRQVRVSSKHVATIPGATEIIYFSIKGDSPSKLLRSNLRRGTRHCGSHNAIACVLLSWDIDITKGADKDRKCIIAKARTTLSAKVYLPRWAGRAAARADLRKWWRSVLLQSAIHEAKHIEIQKRHLAAYRKEARGKPCGSAGILFRRQQKAANKAQAAFDEREYVKPLPPLPPGLRR